MDCRVVVEAAVPVYDVETADEAVRIAIAKTGTMLNPDLNYVEISTGSRRSPSGEELDPAFVVADEALVALELEMTVFNVEGAQHASRIARKEIGQRLENIPLKVLRTEEFDDADDESADDGGSDDDGESGDDDSNDKDRGEGQANGSDAETDESDHDENEPENGSDDDLLPEFEEMVEDER